ncbi:hypothetical protein ACHAW6_005479 [Cyclotella cf. meneghiniana]
MAKTCSFHPSKDVQAMCIKLGVSYKTSEQADAIIIGKELHCINRKNQFAYFCCLPFMDNNKVYVVVCSNLTILQEGKTPFKDEVAPAAPPLNPRDSYIELWESHIDAVPSVNASFFYDGNSLAADMARLHAEGIEVDTKQRTPENVTNEPLLSTVGRWENPRTCPRCADVNIKYLKGSWNKVSLPTIADMDLLMIFQLCMPEEFIREVCIPATNKHIEGENLTLPEFYK